MEFSAKLTNQTIITAKIAAPNELISKLEYKSVTRYSMSALIIRVKRPRVITIAGRLNITTSGLMKALTIEKISAAITITHKLLLYSIPVSKLAAIHRPRPLQAHLSKNCLSIVLFYHVTDLGTLEALVPWAHQLPQLIHHFLHLLIFVSYQSVLLIFYVLWAQCLGSRLALK